ncbi:AAA family ATPase [Streptomyces sp. BBFR2]|uniref:helix-turn-helix transcriptional regulator n=1 Tax=Streptomyces sp. BBFR2 TaxID=3372854 RepID=UPI0037DA2DE6
MTIVSTSHTAAPLFGRDDELRLLGEAMDRARGGHGTSVLLSGEPGIGKSALLDTLARRCADAGLRVLRGAGEELERYVPFHAVRGCLRPRAARPGAEGIGTPGRAFDAAEGVERLLTGHCDDGPVALLVDDLHWADPSSLAVLHRLRRAAAGRLPLLLCLAVRSTGVAPDPDGALRAVVTAVERRLALAPLAAPDVAALAADRTGARTGPGLLRRISAAAGNPLFVTELLGHLTAGGELSVADGVADLVSPAAEDTALPARVHETLQRQLDPLPHRTRDVLEVAAVMGPRVHLADLATAMAAPVMKVWQGVREAVDAGLLTASEHELAFRHPLLRQAQLETVPHSVRIALRQQVGTALAAAGAPPEQVAPYFLGPGVTLGAEALEWLARVARTLAVRAPADAAALLGRALDGLRPGDPRRVTFARESARALLRTGDAPGAERAARAALADGPSPSARRELNRLIAWSAFRQGEHERALEAADTSSGDPRAHAFAAQCHFALGRFPEAEREACRAVAAGEGGGLDATVHGPVVLALLRLSAMRVREALELSDRALRLLGGQAVAPDLTMAPHVLRGLALTDLGRFAEARRAFAPAPAGHDDGGGVFLTACHAGRAAASFHAGHWDDALADIGAGLETTDHLRLHPALRCQAAVIAVHRGEAPHRPPLDGPEGAPGSALHAHLPPWTQALTLEAAGDRAGALDALWNAGGTELPEAGPRMLHHLCPDAARLAGELSDTTRLRHLNRALAATPDDRRTPRLHALELFVRGQLDGDARVLAEAAELFGVAGRVLDEGYARERLAVVLARGERADEARAALGAALSLYDRLGAERDAARAVRQLAGAGLRTRRGPRGRARSGWDALTETERVVVEHVATGRSNPEIAARLFVSPRTVQFHLGGIFSKLGVASRVELAVRASSRGRCAGGPAVV